MIGTGSCPRPLRLGVLVEDDPERTAVKTRLRISLNSGQRIFINGAALRVDRKVSIELLNDASFLLEEHVLEPEAAVTPLRRLYCLLQSMLLEPVGAEAAGELYRSSFSKLTDATICAKMLEGLDRVDSSVKAGRPYLAMPELRGLFALEDLASRAGTSPDAANAS